MPSSCTCGTSRPRAVASCRCSLRLLARDMQFMPPVNPNSRPPSSPSVLPHLETIWIVTTRQKQKGGGFTFETRATASFLPTSLQIKQQHLGIFHSRQLHGLLCRDRRAVASLQLRAV